MFTKDDRLGFPRLGFFGHCSNEYPIKFMENLPIQACVLPAAVSKIDTCEKLGGTHLFNYKIQSGNGEIITPKINKQMKFDLQTFKSQPVTASETWAAVASAGSCACDNVVLEAHYNIYFDMMDPEKPSN